MVVDADVTEAPDVAQARRTAQPLEEIDPLDKMSATISRGGHRDGKDSGLQYARAEPESTQDSGHSYGRR